MVNKFAMTGHTSGIGQTLFEILSPNIVGFSKSSGYDINRQECRQEIIRAIADCNVFINNACPPGFSQTVLFIDLVNVWKDDPTKTIVNVGSNIANPDVILGRNRFDTLYYQAQKIALKEMTDRIRPNVKCKIIYKNFGYVGTEKILQKLSTKFPDTPYISIEDACKIILSDFTS